jgi:hypothetical protein
LPTAETQVRPLLQFELADRAKIWTDVCGRIDAAASRGVTGKINEIIQCLIRGSEEEPYRRRRAELRKEEREKLRRADERDQQRILEAGTNSRRKEVPLSDGDLNRLRNVASRLQDALASARGDYEAIEVPSHHAADQMVMAVEASINRLARWVAEQRADVEAA